VGFYFGGAAEPGHACINLHCADIYCSCGFKGSFCMPPHPHAASPNIKQHSACGENAAATPRHTKKHKANPKSNAFRKPSCGAKETATPTQRETESSGLKAESWLFGFQKREKKG
jgi:hypothetical protein